MASLLSRSAALSRHVVAAAGRGLLASAGARPTVLVAAKRALGGGLLAAAPRPMSKAMEGGAVPFGAAGSLLSGGARDALMSFMSSRSFSVTRPALRPHKVNSTGGRKLRVHKGCKKRFKVTATGKVRFYPPGGRHHKYKLSGRQVQNKRKPRFLNPVDGKKIKMAMVNARNWKPAFPPRKPLRLRSELTSEEHAQRKAVADLHASHWAKRMKVFDALKASKRASKRA